MVDLGVFLNTIANLKRLVERIYENIIQIFTEKHYFVTPFFNFLATFDFWIVPSISVFLIDYDI